jgi:CheY-like chemotaxis protein
VAEVGILIIDDDIVSQQALKNVLDSEGWRVRIVPLAAGALKELAGSNWSLVIVNIALTDLRGPLYAILKELAQAEGPPTPDTPPETTDRSENIETGEEILPPPAPPRRLRVLFLVPALAAKEVQPILEQEGLPYSLKPYHLHDFLEKVSELLLEAGAIAEPIRSVAYGLGNQKRKRIRSARDSRRGAMFASREDYQMTEEEMADWERQEEEDRKKREKEQLERLHRG